MGDEYGLAATEKAMNQRVGHLPLDFAAASAVSSLYRAANAVRNHLTNTVLREHDLSWTGFVVLWSVWIFDGMETRHAATSAAISKGTLTGVAKTLEARGWLTRETDSRDRRQVHLKLTAAGLALMDDLYPRFNAAEAEVVSGIGQAGLPELTGYLRTMVSTVEDMEEC
ncbi:MAG TPA: MarR family transcriptional regulator [Trebonia sp.]|nr:MarR family transcriptional regulator [Trebonia sp.]